MKLFRLGQEVCEIGLQSLFLLYVYSSFPFLLVSLLTPRLSRLFPSYPGYVFFFFFLYTVGLDGPFWSFKYVCKTGSTVSLFITNFHNLAHSHLCSFGCLANSLSTLFTVQGMDFKLYNFSLFFFSLHLFICGYSFKYPSNHCFSWYVVLWFHIKIFTNLHSGSLYPTNI